METTSRCFRGSLLTDSTSRELTRSPNELSLTRSLHLRIGDTVLILGASPASESRHHQPQMQTKKKVSDTDTTATDDWDAQGEDQARQEEQETTNFSLSEENQPW